MAKQIKKYGKITLILGLILAMVGTYLAIPTSQAANATLEKDTLSDSRPTILANHDIKFKMDAATTIAAAETVTVTFNGFTHGATASVIGDWTVLHDADGAGTYTALIPTTDWTFITGAGANPVYTFTFTATGATAIGTNKYIQITFTNGTGKLPNPTAGSYKIDIAGTFGDIGVTYVAIVEGVAVTATVAEYLLFTISDSAIGFGSWTAGSTVVRWATADATGLTSEPGAGLPSLLTIKSNAANGTSVTIRDIGNGSGTAGLYDSVSANLIDAVGANGATAPVSGTEGYAAYAKNLGGTGMTIDEGFDDDVTTPIAIATTAATFISGAAGVNATVDLALKAAIAVTTQPGAYSDTLVLVATPTY
ncbi:hypothetical protein KKA69_01265 [Patescibacteria group bacterium]|nr:hypothetical protein [Patescibacteria group bacterium]